MRIQICAVGRLRAGPELELISDYLNRFDKAGRGLGLGPAQITEIDDRKGPQQENERLAKAIPDDAYKIALDERGRVLSSPQFADLLALQRDHGRASVCFIIGGADGLPVDLRNACDTDVSFGAMVWPHMLARVMLAEQIYRASQILSGTPYHRA